MSSHQEKSKETVTPVPDVTTVSDGEDEEVIDLEAIARLVKAKLDQDLAGARAWNEGIVQKKQERADRLRKKKRMQMRRKHSRSWMRPQRPRKRFWCNLQ